MRSCATRKSSQGEKRAGKHLDYTLLLEVEWLQLVLRRD